MVGHEKYKRPRDISFRPEYRQAVRALPFFVSQALDLYTRGIFVTKKFLQDLTTITRHHSKMINARPPGSMNGSAEERNPAYFD
jgi:hypothetical protein